MHSNHTVEYHGHAVVTRFDGDVEAIAGGIVYDDDGDVDAYPAGLAWAMDGAKRISIAMPSGEYVLSREIEHATPTVRFRASSHDHISCWSMPLVNFVPAEEEPPNPIPFMFGGEPGRIVIVPDYATRVAALQDGLARTAATAVMIGGIGTGRSDVEDLSTWFPYVFLDLLSLASGAPVGAPWIELRDARDQVAQRVHRRLNIAPYFRGHRAIQEDRFSQGIGRLLSRAQAASAFRAEHVAVAIRHLVRSMNPYATLDDQVSQLTRTLDMLSRHYPPSRPAFLYAALDPVDQRAVNDPITVVVAEIRSAADEPHRSPAAREILQRLADGVERASQRTEPTFSDKLVATLAHFGLPDVDVVAPYFDRNVDVGRRKWLRLVDRGRNVTAHQAYIDFRPGSPSMHDTVMEYYRLARHLHDILVRIMLLEYDYKGFYRPKTIPGALEVVNWITPSSRPHQLGYD